MTADNQKIVLRSNQDGLSYAIDSETCHISTPALDQTDNYRRDSGKVKSHLFSQHQWETKLYDGNVCATSKDGKYVAYVLNSLNKGCQVKVMNRESSARSLVKSQFGGCVTDLSWSHELSPLLAIVDERGNIYIHSVRSSTDGSEILVEKVVVISRSVGGAGDGLLFSNGSASPKLGPSTDIYRLVWCPFIPEKPPFSSSLLHSSSDGVNLEVNNNEGEGRGEKSEELVETGESASMAETSGEEEIGKMLAVFHGKVVEVLLLDSILENLMSPIEVSTGWNGREIHMEEVKAEEACYVRIEEESTISTATLSPDATALALGTVGGLAKFYILENFEDIKCAYTWKPHNGKSIDSLCFLDNLVDSSQGDQFWRYALTTADGNRELALWNCENWKKLATLQISAHSSRMDGWGLSLCVDWTGNFLFLSDIERKSFYIIELLMAEGRVRFVSFSDFPLANPILDMAVVKVERRHFRPFSPAGAGLIDAESVSPPPFMDANEEDRERVVGLKAEIVAVFPRSLQELDVRFGANVDKDNEIIANECERDAWNGATPRATSAEQPVESVGFERVSPTAEEVSEIMREGEDELGVVFPRPITPVARVLHQEDKAEEAAAARLNAGQDSTPVPKLPAQLAEQVIVEQIRGMFEESQGGINGQIVALASEVESQRERLEELARVVSAVSDSLKEGSDRLKPEAVSLVIQDAVHRSMAHTVKTELKTALTPQVSDMVRGAKSEMVEKLTVSMDAAVKEQTGKMLKSKALTDNIARSVGEVLSGEIQSSYKETFQKVIVPSYDQSTRTLFSQMNDLFSKGVKDFLDEMGKQSGALESSNEEWRAQVLSHVSNLTDQTRQMLERQIGSLTNSLQSHMDKQIAKVSEKLESSVLSGVRTLVREEVGRAMLEGAGRSVVATPVPNDRSLLQQELVNFLREGDFNGAFKKALSACDLQLLLFLCSKCDTTKIFTARGSILEMPVVLSLLQQLSVDFNGQTELKLRYIEEGILALDDSATVEAHLGRILHQIQSKLRSYQTENPNSPHLKTIKIILMSSAALISRTC